ncbi:UDP-forming cellulose synthase catalytic subunit [Allorhizobium taibaishanense]|uniref:Cellulose synthase catalytic subunit [UDP-forming] n=1 Tax=Allorhizobium taibaishanense TaxID=887144 RepID=A0A1Q9A6T2_9HYPH|nr:UDP-forming cellulose synthase catalytic subunit [Allorhizobium taibaishanense]MBB4008570.1 cellulose synthase (UDP-forming) [Allorhizobium taibaishanense]OLP50282.1 cellulose synthase catalytic subunit (UDP-forming) [Allorhizobium taibaishanense]
MLFWIRFLLWLTCASAMLLLAFLPIDTRTQLVTTFIILIIVAAMKMMRVEGRGRVVFLSLASAIVLRYVYWRTSSTLPPVNQLENFIPGLLLYLAEMYSVMMLFLSLFVVSTPLPPRKPFRTLSYDELPIVDIFVPSYNEEESLLANTLAAARNLDYPADKFTVWLLDDGSTEQKRQSTDLLAAKFAEQRHQSLQTLCSQLGVRYLTRERNEHAKAGNLNNGLNHSTGELVAVFDADHAPARSFLKETVGYFNDDPRLFLVQTPHFFINPDPIERNLNTFNKMPSENEMFYGIIQRGLDKWNAAFFCGSAAVLRREALNEANGFSGLSITEDCETALDLHSRGWNSIFVDMPLIAGLQPATFASFIGQRSRWAQGMMQIMRFRFPLFKRGLSLGQRLCYMSSTMFWLFPFPRAIFLLAPLFYLFFNLQIFMGSGGEFMAYTLSYMLVNLMVQNYLYGSFRWPWISELYEYVQSVHLLPAILSVMWDPRRPTFKVTAKDESVTENRLSEISRPFFLIFLILLIAFGVTIYRLYSDPYKFDVTLVVGGWNLVNLIMAGCALGVVSERGERQSSRRVQVSRRCEFSLGDKLYPAMIDDVSVNGASLQIFTRDRDIFKRDVLGAVTFQPHGSTEWAELPVTIRHSQFSGDIISIGCRYLPETVRHHELIADLIFANAQQWSLFQHSRRRNPGLIGGAFMFLRLSLTQTLRGMHYLLLLLAAKGKADVKPEGRP